MEHGCIRCLRSGSLPLKLRLEGNTVRTEPRAQPWVNDYSGFELIGQFGQTVKARAELTALSMEEVRPGVFVYDMGQNMAGVPKIKLSGLKPGTKVCLRFAEVKYPDLPEYKDHIGMIMLENIRAAWQQVSISPKGVRRRFLPRFTYHGYRFVEITALTSPCP